MSVWGKDTYGDPCRGCGYEWPASVAVMVETVQHTPDKIASTLAGTDGTARQPHLAWDSRSYVCHIVDNLRIWAERIAAATEASTQPVGIYDADLLAHARNYTAVPLSGALWSLRDAVATWSSAVSAASRSETELVHPERGLLGLADVVATNAHDAYHHVQDIRRSVG